MYDKARSFMHSPVTKRLSCAIENVLVFAERSRPAIQSVARRWLGHCRDADGVVRERICCCCLRERKQFGGRWSGEANRHALSLPYDTASRPELPLGTPHSWHLRTDNPPLTLLASMTSEVMTGSMLGSGDAAT